MECARLHEPSDPEMGGAQAVRLRFRLLRLGLEQFVEAALDELLFGLTTEMFAFSVNIPFGHDEQRHDGGPSRRDVDANTAAHAVTHQAALAQSQGVDERDDRSRVLLARIGEVRRLVAVPVAEEVDQERTAPSQRRLNCGWKQLTGRGALPAMQPKQGGSSPGISM